MNLQQIETFVHVAETGSFSKAAVLLETAQPALSRQVRALETELRETLLIRTGRGVTLTDAGRRLGSSRWLPRSSLWWACRPAWRGA